MPMVSPASLTTGSSSTNDGQRDDPLVPIAVDSWSGPVDPALTYVAVAALEASRVVLLPHLRFRLLNSETVLLSEDTLDGRRKNVSFNPATGQLKGSVGHPELLSGMLSRFTSEPAALLRNLLPPYAGDLRPGRTSFRPAEIAGHEYSPRQDDRRLHVDAFPTQPMRVACGCSATFRRWDENANGESAKTSKRWPHVSRRRCRPPPRSVPGCTRCSG